MPTTTAPRPRAAAATRLATLGAIRTLGIVIAIVAAAIGVAYFCVSAVGPTVWWSSLGSDSGASVAFPLPLRLVNGGAFLLWCLTTAAMAFIVADLAWRVRRGVRFVPAVSRAAWGLAITLAVGSTIAQITQNVARYSALSFPDEVDPSDIDPNLLQIAWVVGPNTFLPNPALLGLAIVLAVLAYVIQAGERLQRDTEGLV